MERSGCKEGRDGGLVGVSPTTLEEEAEVQGMLALGSRALTDRDGRLYSPRAHCSPRRSLLGWMGGRNAMVEIAGLCRATGGVSGC